MSSTESILLYKFRNEYGAGYTFNAAIAARNGNEPLDYRVVKLPEGVTYLHTSHGIVLKSGGEYAPVPLLENGHLVACFDGAGKLTLCEAF